MVVRLRAPSAGMHEAAFQLPPDANPRDNVRRQVLAVAAGADFVIVDGSLDGDGTIWLETALAVGNEGWRVARYSADEWTGGTPALGDVVILAGVEDIPRSHAEALAQAVKEGRLGVAYFPPEEGKVSGPLATVLPGVPVGIVTGQQRGMNGPWPAGSLAAGLSDVKEAALARVTAQRVMRYEPAAESVAVGRWADSDLPVMWQRRGPTCEPSTRKGKKCEAPRWISCRWRASLLSEVQMRSVCLRIPKSARPPPDAQLSISSWGWLERSRSKRL